MGKWASRWRIIAHVLFVLCVPPLILLTILRLLDPEPHGQHSALDQAMFVPRRVDDRARAPADAVAVTLPHSWRDSVEGSHVTFFFRFDLSEVPATAWGLFLPDLAIDVSIYLNGKRLGDGTSTAIVVRNRKGPQYFQIPEGHLQSGTNVLAVRVNSMQARQDYLSSIYIGDRQSLVEAYGARVVRTVGASSLVIGVGVVIMAVSLLIWERRRRERIYLWFSLSIFMWTVHNFDMVFSNPPLPGAVWNWLIYTSPGWIAIFAALFANEYLGESRPAVERTLLGGGVVICTATGALTWYDQRLATLAQLSVWHLAAILTAVYLHYRLIRRWVMILTVDLSLMIASGGTALLAGLHDWWVRYAMVPTVNPMIVGYAAPFVMLAFCNVMVRHFISALTQVEAFNRDLEQRAALTQARLEAEHDRRIVLERERILSQERERLMRDMHDGVGGALITALALVEREGATGSGSREAILLALQDLRLVVDSMDRIDGDLMVLMTIFKDRANAQIRTFGVRCTWQLRVIPGIVDLPPTRALQLFRVLQEAVNNALRHSRARNLEISCWMEISCVAEPDGAGGRYAVIEVLDDGVGFDVNGQCTGRGLRNMRARAERADLDLRIESGHDGTRVRIYLKLSP